MAAPVAKYILHWTVSAAFEADMGKPFPAISTKNGFFPILKLTAWASHPEPVLPDVTSRNLLGKFYDAI